MAGANSMQLHRALPLNDSENTELFTFKLSLRNIDEFKSRHIKSSGIYYQGHEWYLTCKFSAGKDSEFIGVYVYWGSPSEGERCKADFRIIMRNIVDPTKSLVTEGSQVEFSAPRSPGWGKKEFAPVFEILSPGAGFLQEPEGIVIVELAMKSCSTILEQYVDFNQVLRQQRDQMFPSHFTSNFRLAGLEFYLSLYPLGDRPEADGHVSIYLHRFVGNDADQSALLGCRLRYRFFVGSLFCPSSSKTFEFSFKNEQGYGRFKGFEPIQEAGVFKLPGPTAIGVEVVACTPFVQPEIKLAVKGYYHLSNISFDDCIFRDHRGNTWKLSVDPDCPTLNLLMKLHDEGEADPQQGRRISTQSDCTKFVQWKAYVMSRSDRRKTLPVIGCPLTAYFSRGLPQKNFYMTTTVPLNKAKSLDGDYSSKEDPSLLVRLEMLNIQDIPGVLYDYPTLDFERFQLYHTREGLKRCLKQNELLMEELATIRGRQNLPGLSSQGTPTPQDSAEKKNEVVPPRVPVPQVPTRPTSLHTSSSLPTLSSQSNSGALPSDRGPPPKPPPRAYSPISNDSNMRRYAFSRMAPLPASTAAPSSVHPSPTNPGSYQYRHPPGGGALASSSNSDSAFKRFSFTGINVTPSMISDQSDSSEVQTPGQTAGQSVNHIPNGNQNNTQVVSSSGHAQNSLGTNQNVVLRRPKLHNAQGPHRGSYQGPSQVPASSESAFKRFSFTGVNVSPALTSDFPSGEVEAHGSVYEQHNPIYQSQDLPPTQFSQNPEQNKLANQPMRIPTRDNNTQQMSNPNPMTNQQKVVAPQTSEQFIQKYTILQPDDMQGTSETNTGIPSPKGSPRGKNLEKERLLQFGGSSNPGNHGISDAPQTHTDGGSYGWRPVDPKNPNSYMETEI